MIAPAPEVRRLTFEYVGDDQVYRITVEVLRRWNSISHMHFEKGGRAHGVDVFDSVEAYQQFVQSTLMPAMGKVAAAKASTFPRWAARE